MRLWSFSHLSPPFPVQVTREARLSCGFGNGKFPGKRIWTYCQTWHFSLGSEAAFLRRLGSVGRKSCMHWCTGVLLSCLRTDVSAKTRVVSFVGQVLGKWGEPLQVESVRTSLGFTLVELCTVCLPLRIWMILVHVYTDGHLYLEYFSSFRRNVLWSSSNNVFVLRMCKI